MKLAQETVVTHARLHQATAINGAGTEQTLHEKRPGLSQVKMLLVPQGLIVSVPGQGKDKGKLLYTLLPLPAVQSMYFEAAAEEKKAK